MKNNQIKRILCAIIILAIPSMMLMSSIAFADSSKGSVDEIDLSGMTYDELLALKDRVNLALWNSKDWQEVTVPQGVWRIGADIPSGHWTIRLTDEGRSSWGSITYSDCLDSSGLEATRDGKIYIYQQLSRAGKNYNAPLQIDIQLQNGTYLVIEQSDVVFSTYSGKPDLGFH